MTEPDDRHDDLASALLDGALPESAAAAARRDPAVLARMAAMAEARDRLRDVPPPDPGARDRAVAAALAAFEPGTGVSGRVADLGESRRRRRSGPPRWLGAAAAVAVVVAGLASLAVLAGDGQDTDDEASLSAEQDTAGDASDDAGSEASEDAGSDDGDEGAAAAPAEPEAAGRAAGYLGSFASVAALTDHVAELASGDFSPGEDEATEQVLPESTLATVACPAESLPPVLRDGTAPVQLYGRADLDGTPVEVWVVSTAGGRQLVAVDQSCRTVVDEALG
jgi:hypothetical protein